MAESKLAATLKSSLLLNSDALDIRRINQLLLAEGIDRSKVRDTMERIRMQCATPPASSCKFVGVYSFKFQNLGKDGIRQGAFAYEVRTDVATYPPHIRVARKQLE